MFVEGGFVTTIEFKQATESYLDSMPQEFYLTGMRDLFGQYHNCADVKGDCIEK